MDKLEALIYEALQKFPSEDIRDLVAKETGLTVEQVSEKMNEAAKAAGISFPSTSFVLNETKSVIKPTESTDTNTSTEDKNTESSTETDDMDAILKGYLDSNKDGIMDDGEEKIKMVRSLIKLDIYQSQLHII